MKKRKIILRGSAILICCLLLVRPGFTQEKVPAADAPSNKKPSQESTGGKENSPSKIPRIVLNFKNKTFAEELSSFEDLKAGDLYQVEIKDINLNLYKVQINKTDSTLSSGSPADIFSTINIETLSSLVSSLSPLGEIAGTIPFEFPTEFVIANKSVRQLDFTLTDSTKAMETIPREDIDEYTGYAYAAKVRSTNPAVKREGAADIIKAAHKKNVEQYAALLQLNQQIEDVKLKYQKYLLKKELEDPANNRLLSLLSELEEAEILKVNTKFNELLKQANSLFLENKVAYLNYLSLIDPFIKQVNENDQLKAGDAKIRQFYDEQLKLQNEVNKSMNSQAQLSLLKEIIAFENNKGNIYTSFPMQFSQEQATVTISVSPRFESNILQSYKTTLAFPVKDKKDFWGISTGFFLSNLTNIPYSTSASITETQDTVFGFVPEERSPFEFGVSAMVRYGHKVKKGNDYRDNIFWHVGFGPGVSITDKIKPRLLAGGGLAFGSKKKVLLDIGGIIGATDKLSNAYKPENTYSPRPENYTPSVVKLGGYFSLSYLFNL
jgi:hypothetical protein